jgi:hypothetical protein
MYFVDLAGDYTENTKLVNAQILQRQDELEQKDKIVADTAELNSQIEEIIASLPITLTKEENLLFIETMEKDLRMEITPVTITDPTIFHTTKLPVRDENGQEIITEGTANTEVNEAAVTDEATVINEAAVTNEGTTTNETTDANDTEVADGTGQLFMTGLQSSIIITFQTTYPKFKKVLEYISEYPEKISVSNATLSYDSSTGDLLAAMTITRYSLTGTGKTYEDPYIGDISIGTDNIFGDPLEETTDDKAPIDSNDTTSSN